MAATNHQIQHRLADYDNPDSFGSRMRARRIRPFMDMVAAVSVRQENVRVLDLGGRVNYWSILPRQFLDTHRVRITLLNLPEDRNNSGEDDDVFQHVSGNACDLRDCSDQSFDIVHSNSLIEHVGQWEDMKRFAAEVHRLAPQHFIQTPYFWFPVEPHVVKPFFHWMPVPVQERLFMRLQMGQRGRARDRDEAVQKVEQCPRLLDITQMRLLFSESEIRREWFGPLIKSLIAIKTLPLH